MSSIAMEDDSPNSMEGGVMRNRPNDYIPIPNIHRIMRRVLPAHAKVARANDPEEMVQECLTEFISFITGEAIASCHSDSRKTITAEDVLAAMATLGFYDYVSPLTLYLNNYRAHHPLRCAFAPPPAYHHLHPSPHMDRPCFTGGRGSAGEASSSGSRCLGTLDSEGH